MRGESRAVGEVVNRLEARLEGFQEGVDARFRQVDARFDRVDIRLDRVEHDVVLLKDAVIENTRELKHLRVAVDKKVDRDEIEPIVEGILRRRG